MSLFFGLDRHANKPVQKKKTSEPSGRYCASLGKGDEKDFYGIQALLESWRKGYPSSEGLPYPSISRLDYDPG